MKAIVKRNEYRKFMTECIDKVYKGELSFREYMNMEIVFEPIDFTDYPAITTETRQYIEKLFTEEDTDRKGEPILRGFTRHEYAEMKWLGMNYGEYSNAYSMWGFNDTEMLIYTYTEGDTTLKMYKDRETYDSEKAETERWYKEVA